MHRFIHTIPLLCCLNYIITVVVSSSVSFQIFCFEYQYAIFVRTSVQFSMFNVPLFTTKTVYTKTHLPEISEDVYLYTCMTSI